jgi:3-deoxy-manno-octulosonate cytidylyltransferase (CMP-KDO synthetase)
MLQHVWERASLARYLTSTIVATDDERVYEAARSFGARVRMTRADHPSGTDRAAEVASAEGAELVVNIQADEPLVDPAAIDAAILPLAHDAQILMGTLKKRIVDPREISDPHVVKVVTGHDGNALYFSRCPVPYAPDQAAPPVYYKHVGLYVYRRDFLLGYPTLRAGPLEQAERLEQLRAELCVLKRVARALLSPARADTEVTGQRGAHGERLPVRARHRDRQPGAACD